MTTIKSALRQLIQQEQNKLPALAEPEILTGKIGRIDWGTSGAGSSGGTRSPRAAAGGMGSEATEKAGSRDYWAGQLIYDKQGQVSVTAYALKSCIVEDDAGNEIKLYFNNPYLGG